MQPALILYNHMAQPQHSEARLYREQTAAQLIISLLLI